MDKEQLTKLYERYKDVVRSSPKLNMRAYWNDYVAHALAFAIGVEDTPPPEGAYKRLAEYYVEYRLVASQQLVDAFIAHATDLIVQYSGEVEVEAPELTLEDVGVAPEVVNKLSRRGITSVEDIYTNELDLTDRQFGMLTDALVAGLKRIQAGEGESDGELEPDEPVEESAGENGDSEPGDESESEGEGDSNPEDSGDEAPSDEEDKG